MLKCKILCNQKKKNLIRSEILARGWITPVSLFANIMVTKQVFLHNVLSISSSFTIPLSKSIPIIVKSKINFQTALILFF